MKSAFRRFTPRDRSRARVRCAYFLTAALLTGLLAMPTTSTPARAGEGVFPSTVVETPQAPVVPKKLPKKPKKTGLIKDICEMQWVAGGAVECVQGSAPGCSYCSMHNGSATIPQPTLLPNDSSRNSYWCGCP